MSETTPMRFNEWEPQPPQLIRNARMMIMGYRADPAALVKLLPPGLAPSDEGIVQMNMYEVADEQTSGFGPFSLTYLAIEIARHDSEISEGVGKIPGRYFAFYWNSSARVRAYVRGALGTLAMPGTRRLEQHQDVQESILSVEGRDAIRARIRTRSKAAGSLAGHLNYYSRRSITSPEGGNLVLDELIEFPLPFIADMYEASVDGIVFDFPDGHPAAALKPVNDGKDASVLYADVTFTYSTGRRVRNYLQAQSGRADERTTEGVLP